MITCDSGTFPTLATGRMLEPLSSTHLAQDRGEPNQQHFFTGEDLMTFGYFTLYTTVLICI